ncbi:MAG TPA: hypothetical protein VFV75_01615 [Candidatus Polarisedimenticolaceae bacterium]|nr:hypothetical protein [Candidatus Polarisedimenticolaceae bacterium]
MRRWMVLAVACAALLTVFLVLPAGRALSQEVIEVMVRNWPKSFKVEGPVEVTGGPLRRAALVEKLDLVVPPVGRGDLQRWFDAGTIEMDGYPAVVLSLTGQQRGQQSRVGSVGAVLVPDADFVQQVYDEARLPLFSLEVAVDGVGPTTAYFSAEQKRFVVGFPRYRVRLYNTTDKTVTAHLYAYLTE